ncbi:MULTISPECIES: EamA family transporter [unclassified Pseudomonas]|uniref:EamA family transporter n=1 Tax=unclassified Pseudomonas TaxID=196821 RepID=UPI00095BA668|nr:MULTISPECIES: EamA family transporter [unclassified Pseudomonas]OLU18509.1 EamA family transporter [Pseudomonas sp. PA1(2017)]OLU26505.1 EamA family transporter [Pseudomonas sp. PA27(2017)]
METSVFLMVIAAAALHAGWNALLKIGLDRFLTASLIQIGAGIVALLALPFVAVPNAAAWPWIILSALLHIGYNLFLSRAYQHGDLGQVYPISRGSSPLLVAVLSILLLGEVLPAGQWLGLGVLVGGIWLMAIRGGRGKSSSGLLINALLTALFIAGYTLADASGARANGDPLSYSAWLFAVNGLVMALVILGQRGPGVLTALGPHWRAGLLGGAMSMLAYSIAIWAMTLAPVALVSALRETSVVFALLIGRLWLKESLPPLRAVACLIILAGVAMMKLA